MNWYLRKQDGAVYGPVDFPTLQKWAGDGRIAPEDLVSEEQKNWTIAPNVEELRMEWIVELPDGSTYGPLNLLSLREPLKDGTVQETAPLRHVRTGDMQPLADALREFEAELAAKPEPDEADVPSPPAEEPPEDLPSTWAETARRKDFFEKRATKWQTLYEEIREENLRNEENYNEQVRKLKASEISARKRLSQVEQQLSHLQQSYDQLKETTREMTQNSPDAAHAVALMEAHTELTRIYDEVLQRLDDKSVEVEQMQETLQQREKEMQERVQSLQQRLETEQEDTDALRAKLSDLEDSHIQVLRSYRDMNDRLIRLRQMYEGQTVAVQQPKVAPTKPEKESRRREHARIRLRRPGGD